jgi:hypothetical protein
MVRAGRLARRDGCTKCTTTMLLPVRTGADMHVHDDKMLRRKLLDERPRALLTSLRRPIMHLAENCWSV